MGGVFIRFGTKLCGRTVGVPVGAGCAPLVADLFLFCCGRNFVGSLSRENQADIIEAFNSALGYLDGLLNVDSLEFSLTIYFHISAM